MNQQGQIKLDRFRVRTDDDRPRMVSSSLGRMMIAALLDMLTSTLLSLVCEDLKSNYGTSVL
jgi:hypothetical protein